MMKLKVPLIQQREGSYHCQVASLLMVMSYFGDHIDYDDLLAELRQYLLEDGMHNQGAILYLRKKGYETFFAHHDLEVLNPDIENVSEKDIALLEKALSETSDDEKDKYRKEKLALDIKYIKAGGKYSTRLPDFKFIDEYLEKEIPVVLGAVRNKALHLNPTAGAGNHAIVVVGKEGDHYFINDPSPNTAGEYSIHTDRLLHAWYNSAVNTRVAWK